MRLACEILASGSDISQMRRVTHIFDIWTWVDVDNIAVLNSEVVADYTVHPGTPIIKVIVGQDDQHRVLSLLTLDKHRVTSEEL